MREGYEELIKLVHFMEKNSGKCVDQFVGHCMKREYQISWRYSIKVSLKTLKTQCPGVEARQIYIGNKMHIFNTIGLTYFQIYLLRCV